MQNKLRALIALAVTAVFAAKPTVCMAETITLTTDGPPHIRVHSAPGSTEARPIRAPASHVDNAQPPVRANFAAPWPRINYNPDETSIQTFLDWKKSNESVHQDKSNPTALSHSIFEPQESEESNNTAGQPSKQYKLNGKILTEKQYEGLTLSNHALGYIRQCLWDPAEFELSRATKLYPDLSQAHTSRAYVLARLDRELEALSEANEGIQLSTNRPEPVCILAQIYQGYGMFDDAIKQDQLLVRRFPKHPAVPITKAMHEALEVDLAEQHQVTAPDDSDYFAYVTRAATVKWAKEKFPLKVYVPTDDEGQKIGGYDNSFGEALRDSFRIWQKQSNNLLSFTMVKTPEQADIECDWVSDPAVLSNPCEGGDARVKYDAGHGGLQHVRIVMSTMAPGTPHLSNNDVKRTALQEIGHSVGLLGHSPMADDVLFCALPLPDKDVVLSERDKKTLAHLYRADVPMSANYRSLDLSGNSLALNADGLQLLNAGDLTGASEKFSGALTINPNCEPARRNMAVCLHAQAAVADKGGNSGEAATDLELALNLDVGGERGDRDNRIAMLRDLARIYTAMKRPEDAREANDAVDRLVSLAGGTASGARSTAADATTTAAAQAASTSSTNAATPLIVPGTASNSASSGDVDFGPYMDDLQKKIKKGWFPPKGKESKRVQLTFVLHRMGELTDLTLHNSSGDALCDRAAMKAVIDGAPYAPLPKGADNTVDIMFTFDYNVFGRGGSNTFTSVSTINPEDLILRWILVVQSMPTAENLYGLGNAYEKAKKPERAEAQYRKALALDPGFYLARDALNALEAKQKDAAAK
jgi:TonB family protein